MWRSTASALDRRFGSDYRILTAGSAADGLAELGGLARGAEQVALVAADLHLPDGDGVEFLERAAGLHRGVVRILLFNLDEYHTRIPFRELPRCSGPRSGSDRRLDGEGLGEPGGVALPTGAGGAQRLVDGAPAEACGLPGYRRAVGSP